MPITISIPGVESWDDDNNEFVYTDDIKIVLEHSLVSVSKWESVFEKPFLGPEKKTSEETYAYIHAMCLNEIDGQVLLRLTEQNLTDINDYIESGMTATTFREMPGSKPGSRAIITNELIRYWMITFNVPLEYETRHLNQLFTLIKVINEKNKPQKKMNRHELAARNRELNAARKAQMGTTG